MSEKVLSRAKPKVGFFQRLFQGMKKRHQRFWNRFRDSSTSTKITHLVMGYGNLAHRQYVKGILYLVIEILFLLFMIFSPQVNATPFGGKALVNLITLGTNPGDIWTETDNSMLMLLFGVITLGVIGMFFFAWGSAIKSSYEGDLALRKGKKPSNFVEDVKSLFDERFHVLMLTPSILGIVVFTVLPTVFMILIAFTNFDSQHPSPTSLFDWVGFENFANIFRGTGEIAHRFLPVLGWTLTWAFFATFSCYLGGVLLALLINKKEVRMKKVWRTVFILTIAMPQFVSLLAVRNLISLNGPFNQLLLALGLVQNQTEFLGLANNPWTARIAVLVINLWIGVPYSMLMTSGILMNVPQDLFEAAKIDGATNRQIFFHVTLPYIIFVTTPYLITSFIGNITSFNIIYLLTGGAPANPGFIAGGTDLLVTWLYKLTIDQNEYNLGSVVAIFTFILTATGTLLAYRNSKAFKEEDTFQL